LSFHGIDASDRIDIARIPTLLKEMVQFPKSVVKGRRMSTTDAAKAPEINAENLREEWLDRLSKLVSLVQSFAHDLDWSTRAIEKSMEDAQIGAYTAPALILQFETVRVLLDPIARSAPGAEGVVDLYLMPAYDDIASLYFEDGVWRLHYMFPDASPVNTIREAAAEPLSKESLAKVLEEMRRHAE
jgi:hypothetical protein